MIKRHYQKLENYLEPNRALIIFGPRRVGKTTLLENYLEKTNLKYRLDSGDNLKIQQILGSQNFEEIKEYASGYQLIAIDEAQHIPNVGMGLKILVDHVPDIKVIATGSSWFELAGQVGEPLTGRKKTLTLYPVSLSELNHTMNRYELKENLEKLLIYGSYPKVISSKTKSKKKEVLEEIINSYLLKDIFAFHQVKGSKVILDLLRLVAYQVGNEVSLSELGQKIGLDYKTVKRYLDLLEKSFVIFELRGFSKNLRKEITKKSKYYFFDVGIRNTLISNFTSIDIRDDLGQIWENFLISERTKTQSYQSISVNNYFWQTWDKKEIDWVEEREGKLFGYEFKWQKKTSAPQEWLETYENARYKSLNRENFWKFIGL